MGARNNRALKEPKNKSAKAAALNKKFKKKPCSFCRDKVTYIDYKDIATLRKYISDRGKIRLRVDPRPRRRRPADAPAGRDTVRRDGV